MKPGSQGRGFNPHVKYSRIRGLPPQGNRSPSDITGSSRNGIFSKGVSHEIYWPFLRHYSTGKGGHKFCNFFADFLWIQMKMYLHPEDDAKNFQKNIIFLRDLIKVNYE
jgi:hypothetical protein